MSDAQATFAINGETLSALKSKAHPSPFLLRHTLFFLPVLVLASVGVLFLSWSVPILYRWVHRLLYRRKYQPIALEDDEDDGEDGVVPSATPVMPSNGLVSDFRKHVRSLREYGTVLFALEVLRTLCLVALLALSIVAAIQAESPDDAGTSLFDVTGHWGKKKKHKKGKKHHKNKDASPLDDYSSLEWGEFGVTAFYVYTFFLSFLLLTLRPATPIRRHLITHLDTLLFFAWCLYAYRDLWPLLTYYLVPTDINNAITWSRVGLLSTVAVAIPLLRPRTYVPIDPEHPTPPDQIHPEQNASWLSFLFYEFMTSLVFKAWKVPSLAYEDIHPLADYDQATVLYKNNLPWMDPLKRKAKGLKQRHLFLLLVWNYRFEAVVTSLMCMICAFFEFSGSIGINQLLKYIETAGEGASYKPIVWIALLFIGPLFNSLSIQHYIFLMTRALVRAEALLTQLIFDHALRLRMRDSTEGEEENKGDDAASDNVPAITVDEAPTEGIEAVVTPDHDGLTAVESVVAGVPAAEEGAGAVEEEPQKETKGSEQSLAGRINVLMAADVESVVQGRDLPLVFVYTPFQFILCTVFLYKILSWSSIVGMLTMVVTMPLPGLLTKMNADYQHKRMSATDARVGTITEAVGALRMIKMFGWESKIKDRVYRTRETELDLIWKRRLVGLITNIINIILPVITMSVTFALYTIVQKRELTASAVFTSMTVFDLIKGQMGMTLWMVNEFVTAGVSLNRINKFLLTSEMIDEFDDSHVVSTVAPAKLEAEEQGLIRLHNAVFTWGSANGNNTPGFRLTVPDVSFVKGNLNLITGPTGSGKSSFLKALIGELHFIPGGDSFYYLPRDGGVSYAAQESWCMSESIKDNILFGEPYDAERYKAVIHDCGLETDLKILDDGDETEIGEKGVTLSGGQKARVTLARAVYSDAKIVLLDDIFSALDTLTSRHVIENLFKGPLLRGRTVVLITHHFGLVAPIADYVVALDATGTVTSAGPIDDSIVKQAKEREEKEVTTEEAPVAAATAEEEEGKEKKVAAKLILAEEKSEGRISRKAMISFFSHFGGPFFWTFYFGMLFVGQGITVFQTKWLGYWSQAYEDADDWHQVSIPYYLGLYTVWVILSVAFIAITEVVFYLGAIKACRRIHQKLVDAVFGSYLRFLDTTPVGRIISRFTKDMKAIDGNFTETSAGVFDLTVTLLIKFVVVIIAVPFFALPGIVIGVVGGVIGELYIHSQLSIKREMSNAKSPLFSHFSAAVNGIVSIRAYGAQSKLRAEAQRRADKYTRAARTFYNLNRWVTVRVDMLGGLFAASLASFIVYGPSVKASEAGFVLSQAISLSSMILWWVRMVNDMEVQGNSVERIEDYLVIDQEPSSASEKQPPAAWPTSGQIVIDKLSAKYSADGPLVLDNLEVTIQSGEKVGIVGRTGSGKSTLALALLRLIPTTGEVVIDGRKTSEINLSALRSNVTIIPQDPILLSGTLRFNLDPFGDYDDAVLNDALQRSGLGQVARSKSGAATPQRLTLDFQIAPAGGNLSQGQRQLVALARALVRQSKVLILDEATASVDFETDALIQRSIRELPDSTTVLTVAHRLATVMDYDKILVLGKGKLLEYDSPANLKNNQDSYFAKLVQAMDG